jgi:uncharacterized membrane protein YdbT with pleckstrin-like domain
MADIFISEKQTEERTANLESSKVSFSSFLLSPKEVDFEMREQNEKVLLLLRKHPATNFRWITISLLLICVPTLIIQLMPLDFIPTNFQFILSLAWYLIVISYAFENFLTWFFNVHLITNERVVDIDFSNLIYKEVNSTNFDKIQDVTYKTGGIIRSLFRYGDLLIQTAAEVEDIEFLGIPCPYKVAKLLEELRIGKEK